MNDYYVEKISRPTVEEAIYAISLYKNCSLSELSLSIQDVMEGDIYYTRYTSNGPKVGVAFIKTKYNTTIESVSISAIARDIGIGSSFLKNIAKNYERISIAVPANDIAAVKSALNAGFVFHYSRLIPNGTEYIMVHNQ